MVWQSKIENTKNGFTLVEVLVVIVLLGIIVIGVSGLYLGQIRLTGNEFKESEVEIKTAAVLNDIFRIANQATTILASATINSNNYLTGPNTVVLSLPSLDGANNAIEGSDDILVYRKNAGSDLELIIDPAAGSSRTAGAKIMLSDIADLEFGYENELDPVQSGWLNVKISQNVELSTGSKSLDLTYTIVLKNK